MIINSKDNDFRLLDGEIQRLSLGGGDLLDSPQVKGKFRQNGMKNINGNMHGHHQNPRNQQMHNQSGQSLNQQNSMNNHQHQQHYPPNTISNRKHTPSIFNNDILDDNMLLGNDDINEQFNDSVLMMTKQSSKFNSPTYFQNKINVEEFMVTSGLGKSNLSEPQLLEGIEQELFGKNIELPNNIDVQIRYNHDHNDIHNNNNNNHNDNSHTQTPTSQKIINQGDSILNKISIEGQKERASINDSNSKGKGLNEKFISILNEVQKDTIEQADFTYADMGDEGILGICDALKQNKHLKSLKLQRNKISDKGAQCLVDNIFENQSNIGTLYLQDNMISDKFLDYVVLKVSKMNGSQKKLESIYLKNNLLNVNKTQKVIEELKKQSINIYL